MFAAPEIVNCVADVTAVIVLPTAPVLVAPVDLRLYQLPFQPLSFAVDVTTTVVALAVVPQVAKIPEPSPNNCLFTSDFKSLARPFISDSNSLRKAPSLFLVAFIAGPVISILPYIWSKNCGSAKSAMKSMASCWSWSLASNRRLAEYSDPRSQQHDL